MLLFGIKGDGYLFLGSRENPMPISQHLQVINKKWKLYKKMETKRTINFDGFSLPQMIDIKDKTAVSFRENTSQNMNTTLAEAVNTPIINDLEYLAVCIDENNHVVKTYGDTTKYLLQKNVNLNLAQLLPRPLAVAFNALSINAKKPGSKASILAIEIKYNEAVIDVSLSVRPLILKQA